MEQKKKVSVVMCTYNGEKYLREQLDSIVNQTYPIHELIVQDDGSKDGTLAVLQAFKQKYPYIYIYQNVTSLGINRNFISAIRKATGDYIAISDQDDIWDLHKIEWQMASIGDKLLSSGFSKPFISGENIQVHFDGRIPNCATERLMYVGALPGHTQLFKKEFLTKIPDLDKWLELFMYDHLFQIAASVYHGISFCDKILVHQRRYASAATYTVPVNCKKSVFNAFATLKRTWNQYRVLKPDMMTYFGQVHAFLSSFPSEGTYKAKAQELALHLSQGSFVSYIKLTWLCVQLRDRIFYVKEKNPILSVIRALLFPVTCSDYFRYLMKNHK